MSSIAKARRSHHLPLAARAARAAAPAAGGFGGGVGIAVPAKVPHEHAKMRHVPWTADMAVARADADKVLASLDWSKRDFLINVPGTGDHQIIDPMHAALRESFGPGEVSLVHLDYPTGIDFRRSVPQGLETLRLVLAGIAERGKGQHRIYLFGQSQGAILMGEIMRDPIMRAGVERVAMWGHPSMAVTHHHTPGADPKVFEYSNRNDPISLPTTGSPYKWLDALGELTDGHLGAAPEVLDGLLHNARTAILAGLWIARGKLFPASWMVDPHGYEHAYGFGLAFLKAGMALPPIDPAVAAANAARLVQSVAAGPHPWPIMGGQPDDAGAAVQGRRGVAALRARHPAAR